MMNLTELQWALVRYCLADVSNEQLSAIAMALVGDGIESPAIWRLVDGLSSREETLEILREAVENIGLSADMESAVRSYVDEIARQIIRREIAAHEGAKKIWDAALLVPGAHDYDPFIYAASEYDDRADDRRFFEAEIVKEAQRRLNAVERV